MVAFLERGTYLIVKKIVNECFTLCYLMLRHNISFVFEGLEREVRPIHVKFAIDEPESIMKSLYCRFNNYDEYKHMLGCSGLT